MIEVPVEVKEALKDGRLKKNYKIKVYHFEKLWSDLYTYNVNHHHYEIDVPGYYKLSSDNDFTFARARGGDYILLTTKYIDGHYETDPIECQINDDIYNFEAYGEEVVFLSKQINGSGERIDDFTIDNDNLISESISIDERLCTGDSIVYGLCEGSSIEFQYFGYDNIRDKSLEIHISIQCAYGDDVSDYYDIPMGYFTVDGCSRQAATGIYKVTAYNKLRSKYLDQKANQLLADVYTEDYTLSFYDIKKTLLQDYQVSMERIPYDPGHPGPSMPQTIPSSNVTVGPFVFTKKYGPETPLNAYVADVNANEQFYITFNANAPRYSITPSIYCEIDIIAGFMEGFERSIVNYIKDLFDNSDIQLVGSDSSLSVGDAVISEICYNGGFYNLCGIKVTETRGLSSNTYYYSTIDYEHQAGASSPIRDIMYRALGGDDVAISVSLCHPAAMIMNAASGMIKFDGTIMDAGGYHSSDNQYYYHDENDVLREGEWHPAKFSDGTDYVDLIYSMQLYEIKLSPAEKLKMKISDMPEFTLRELVSGIYETLCQFGQLNRETDLFSGIELNRSRLYPAEDLYPDDQLYPGGGVMSASNMIYSQLWADDANMRLWRYLIITYKTLNSNNEEVEEVLQKTINGSGTDDYIMSDNWLFKNLIWDREDVEEYAEAMVAKMQGITWFPFEMWLAGLPYIETGDEIEVSVNGNTYPTYVLQRQLQGIQNLQDTYINGTLDIF